MTENFISIDVQPDGGDAGRARDEGLGRGSLDVFDH
jgi:hypothetical protein